MPALELKDVHVARGGRSILTGLDLVVEAGQSIAVRGTSGSGKSTLLAIAAGLLPSDCGEVLIGGRVLSGLGDGARSSLRLRQLGLVFQTDELLPELTVFENVSLPLRLAGTDSREATRRVAEVLDRLGIGGLVDRRTHEVSGGQLQRAAIARAIVHRPAAVLADEPTASLDEETAWNAMNLLVSTATAEGAAVLVVTHDKTLARTCDVETVLVNGRLESGEC